MSIFKLIPKDKHILQFFSKSLILFKEKKEDVCHTLTTPYRKDMLTPLVPKRIPDACLYY